MKGGNFRVRYSAMHSVKWLSGVFVSLVFCGAAVRAEPAAWWKFEVEKGEQITESVTGTKDKIEGGFRTVAGVSGGALKLDGFSGYILRRAEQAPVVSGAFSIEAWVALGGYPVNWCPIVEQQSQPDRGYFFGIDAWGHPGLQLSVGGKWKSVQSEIRLPLRKWIYVAGVYSPEKGAAVYINGEPVSSAEIRGVFTPAPDCDLFIGKHGAKAQPEGTLRPEATAAVHTYLDAIVDELKISNLALTAEQIAENYAASKPTAEPDIPPRVLPAGPCEAGPFGAYYTKLKYYEEWDAPWRVSDYPDVVVRFDDAPYRFVFWRGTSYIPHWVTENGIWYDNEFNETWGHGVKGCAEPMSDKQCRHSHVRIIESHNARVVVHWRYALVDNFYTFARVDEATGWGDWTDEVYYIYPDGVGIRKITLHSTNPEQPHEWQEGIIVMGPGQRPDEVLEPEAVTLANMNGETATYSWEHSTPDHPTEPRNANIQVINTKSKYKSFVIVLPESKPRVTFYRGEIRREVCIFPWWNHWPTAPKPSDGRWAMDCDQASHSALTHTEWKEHSKTENTMTKIMMHGMTDKPAGQLVPLASSWAKPPRLVLSGSSFVSLGYDVTQRAYVLSCRRPGRPQAIKLGLAADRDSPVLNPGFVLRNWGQAEASLKINGRKTEQGKDFRVGHYHRLEGSDLIVWIRAQSSEPVKIELAPVDG